MEIKERQHKKKEDFLKTSKRHRFSRSLSKSQMHFFPFTSIWKCIKVLLMSFAYIINSEWNILKSPRRRDSCEDGR